MRKLYNLDLRKEMVGSGLMMKDVAAAMGITSQYLSVMFMHDLRDYEREKVLKGIAKARNWKNVKKNNV